MIKKLSIVVPCYNEEKNIPLILDKFSRAIGSRKDIEVVLVNNGSTDNSELILNELLPRFPFAKSVLVKFNQGYGFGILSGLKESDSEYVGWTHADLQTDPYDVIKALEKIESLDCPTDIFIKGNRKNRPFLDQFFTSGMSFFETVYLGVKLYDINAQPNIFHRSFYMTWVNPPHDFSLDLYVLYAAKKNKLNIIRFDVVFPERIHGTSSWNTGLTAKWKFIKRTLNFSKKLKGELKNEFYSA